jgi:hypothetical protein
VPRLARPRFAGEAFTPPPRYRGERAGCSHVLISAALSRPQSRSEVSSLASIDLLRARPFPALAAAGSRSRSTGPGISSTGSHTDFVIIHSLGTEPESPGSLGWIISKKKSVVAFYLLLLYVDVSSESRING